MPHQNNHSTNYTKRSKGSHEERLHVLSLHFFQFPYLFLPNIVTLDTGCNLKQNFIERKFLEMF